MLNILYLFFALDQIKKFAFLGILENDEDVTACINELKVLYNMRVVKPAQYFNLTFYFFKDVLLLNLALVQNFDGHFMLRDFIDRHYRDT